MDALWNKILGIGEIGVFAMTNVLAGIELLIKGPYILITFLMDVFSNS